MDMRMNRAWIEVDLNSLENNICAFRRRLAPTCDIMGVVKANAYGHGYVIVAKALKKMGVTYLGVACLQEAMLLRKAGITAEILVMGYTLPECAGQAAEQDIILTVVDLAHATALNEQGIPLRVHVKIDTGMHRLGQSTHDLQALSQIYRLANLRIEGSFSHLCVAEMNNDATAKFTQAQIDSFHNTVQALCRQGIEPGKLHIQNSYGIANCTPPNCSLARAGILMYGAKSAAEDTLDIQLCGVGSVRARIGMVHELKKGQGIGYGLAYTAQEDMRIATVTIGYADGLPRALSNGAGSALVLGQRAPIVGRVCMDMLMLNVTGIPNVNPGDVATFIGSDGEEHISAEDVAQACGSIANEVLSRLGERLERIPMRDSKPLHDKEI